MCGRILASGRTWPRMAPCSCSWCSPSLPRCATACAGSKRPTASSISSGTSQRVASMTRIRFKWWPIHSSTTSMCCGPTRSILSSTPPGRQSRSGAACAGPSVHRLPSRQKSPRARLRQERRPRRSSRSGTSYPRTSSRCPPDQPRCARFHRITQSIASCGSAAAPANRQGRREFLAARSRCSGPLMRVLLEALDELGVDVDGAEVVDEHATRRPCCPLRIRLSSVVFPAPRNPVRRVTGTGSRPGMTSASVLGAGARIGRAAFSVMMILERVKGHLAALVGEVPERVD